MSETVKKKIYKMLDECNEQSNLYNELLRSGMGRDEKFEAILNTRKITLTEILELLVK